MDELIWILDDELILVFGSFYQLPSHVAQDGRRGQSCESSGTKTKASEI